MPRPTKVVYLAVVLEARAAARLDWIVGTMEAANDTGRRAANAVLHQARSREHPAPAMPHYRMAEWEPLQKIDEERYRDRQPNMFDRETSLHELKAMLRTPR